MFASLSQTLVFQSHSRKQHIKWINNLEENNLTIGFQVKYIVIILILYKSAEKKVKRP